jgi:spore maturation protein CgeB
MLHERNSEVLDLYHENEEIACFDSVEELAEKIDYYLAHPMERASVARAGHARCVPAYSYDDRMAKMVRWHFGRPGISSLQMHLSKGEAS